MLGLYWCWIVLQYRGEYSETAFCDVWAVVGVDAEMVESSVDDVSRTEDVIVKRWRDVSADEELDEVLRPRLVVVRRAT